MALTVASLNNAGRHHDGSSAGCRTVGGSAQADDAASLTGSEVVQELCAVASPPAADPGTEPRAGG